MPTTRPDIAVIRQALQRELGPWAGDIQIWLSPICDEYVVTRTWFTPDGHRTECRYHVRTFDDLAAIVQAFRQSDPIEQEIDRRVRTQNRRGQPPIHLSIEMASLANSEWHAPIVSLKPESTREPELTLYDHLKDD